VAALPCRAGTGQPVSFRHVAASALVFLRWTPRPGAGSVGFWPGPSLPPVSPTNPITAPSYLLRPPLLRLPRCLDCLASPLFCTLARFFSFYTSVSLIAVRFTFLSLRFTSEAVDWNLSCVIWAGLELSALIPNLRGKRRGLATDCVSRGVNLRSGLEFWWIERVGREIGGSRVEDFCLCRF